MASVFSSLSHLQKEKALPAELKSRNFCALFIALNVKKGLSLFLTPQRNKFVNNGSNAGRTLKELSHKLSSFARIKPFYKNNSTLR